MNFTLLPAVDVAGGLAVGMARGESGAQASGEDARDRALAWQAAGAEWIHLVDLDAAFGRGSNHALLASITGELDVPVQLSGGVRDEASLTRSLSTGCERVVLATQSLEDPSWCARAIADHGDRVAIALDVRVLEGSGAPPQHRLAPRGGTSDGGDLWETLVQLDRYGCARYVVTDVSRDGMLSGPNLELYRGVTRATPAPVIVSGGVASIGDLTALAEIATGRANLEGAIVGKALYAARCRLAEALDAVRQVE